MGEESKPVESQVAQKVESQEKVSPPNGGGEMGAEATAKENSNSEKKQEPGSNNGEALDVKEKKTEDGVKAEEAPANEKKSEPEAGESSSSSVEHSASFREESNLPSDLKENEKKALIEFKSKLEDAIAGNKLFEVKKAESPVEGEGKEKVEEKKGEKTEKKEEKGEKEGEKSEKEGADKKGKSVEKGEEEKAQVKDDNVDKDIALWGIPLLPSKGDERIDVLLLKFLRAREFKVDEAYEMLKKTLLWRKENSIDCILSQNFGADLSSVGYMNGVDREGRPVCYNVYGILGEDDIYSKTFGSEEQRERFLKWRFQLMEKGIQKLDLKPGGVSSLLQVNDLKNTPGPSRKELRQATKQVVDLLQDNYPEFVARNIFINVPFWYYAFNAVLSPFFTQRTKSKFVFARPSRVTETLLKYIPADEIPTHYGGFKRENDSEFSKEDVILEAAVKAGATESIEIPTPEAGAVTVWDLSVLGWEVNYKEEFVPADEGSYTVIVQKGKKMGWQDEPVRNSFRNNEPGKIVLTVENGLFKKKRALYRYKIKSSSS